MTGPDERDALTPAERAAFAQLPRNRRPTDALEEDVIAALHSRGVLHDAAPLASTRPLGLPWRAAAALALATFGGGVATGRAWRTQAAVESPATPRPSAAASATSNPVELSSARATEGRRVVWF
ncbi:MAG: hypothetical protein HY275_14240 [Gemmatimonadetes bacterium]|nr:hypothetical protein [Gemmatimonadota bacterium]